MERPWPLTGRDAELRAVAAALRPGAAGIVVAGPAGVGKTRLARDAVGGRPGPRYTVVWAFGSLAARSLPLGAFAGLLDIPAGDPAGTVGRVLRQLDRMRPFVLVVDDAHLLDEHSAILLHRVALRRLAPVLVTVRSGESAPDAVTSLWKDEHVGRVDLAPLDLRQTAELVSRVLGGPVESSSVYRLWELTRGTPLFLRHLVIGEVAAARFTPASGLWQWTQKPVLTQELVGLLRDEFGSLDAGLHEVVDVVSLAEPVAIDALAGLTSIEEVERAENRGLVQVEGGVARLAHPLYGEVRRGAMGALRARRLRGRVAQTLDAGNDLIRRAVLTLDSDLPPDPVLFLSAAQAATSMYDLPLAERLARAAASGSDPIARLVHAAALSWLSRGKESEAILADLAEAAPDGPLRTFAHVHRAGNFLWTMARPDLASRRWPPPRPARRSRSMSRRCRWPSQQLSVTPPRCFVVGRSCYVTSCRTTSRESSSPPR